MASRRRVKAAACAGGSWFADLPLRKGCECASADSRNRLGRQFAEFLEPAHSQSLGSAKPAWLSGSGVPGMPEMAWRACLERALRRWPPGSRTPNPRACAAVAVVGFSCEHERRRAPALCSSRGMTAFPGSGRPQGQGGNRRKIGARLASLYPEAAARPDAATAVSSRRATVTFRAGYTLTLKYAQGVRVDRWSTSPLNVVLTRAGTPTMLASL